MELTSNNETTLQAYKLRLGKLQCPFTWNMDSIILSGHKKSSNKPNDTEHSLPLQKFLFAIMRVYVNVKDGVSRDTIEDHLEKCYERFDTLENRDDPQISTKVARAVLHATKCHVYFEFDKLEELERELNVLENIDNMNAIEESTLLGCKSICWAKYDRVGTSDAKDLIREAINLNDNCALWHYVLGKIMRHQRRTRFIAGEPCQVEESSFLKAYQISKNHNYGIFVASMYHESRKYDKALELYDDLYNDVDALNGNILLRLALGFIRLRNRLTQAKDCLDKAEKITTKRSMYFHYKAKYHMKKREFDEASYCFEEAIKDDNLFAEMEYFQRLLTPHESFDAEATKYLETVLEKYKSFPKAQLQPINLQLAFSYWLRENNLEQAINYFSKAIEMDSDAKCLTNFLNNDSLIESKWARDVYFFLETVIFPDFEYQRHRFDETTVKNVGAIKNVRRLRITRRIPPKMPLIVSK